MKQPKQYATPEAFKRALEDRIKAAALHANMAEVTSAARAFLDPVLLSHRGTWDAERAVWSSSRLR